MQASALTVYFQNIFCECEFLCLGEEGEDEGGLEAAGNGEAGDDLAVAGSEGSGAGGFFACYKAAQGGQVFVVVDLAESFGDGGAGYVFAA